MPADKVEINLLAPRPSSQAEFEAFRKQYVNPLLALDPAIPEQRAELERWIKRDELEVRTTHDDSYDSTDHRDGCCPLRVLAQKAREIIQDFEEEQRQEKLAS